MFGLSKEELNILKNIISKYKNVKKAIIYGSRAVGNYKKGSDIDIVLFGKDLKNDIFYIQDKLEENLPYFIDINIYDNIKNDRLKKHIKNVGKVIYG